MELSERRCQDNHDVEPLWILICGNLDCGVNILADEFEGGNYVANLEAVVEAARKQNKNWHSPIVTEALEALDNESEE